jgi:erythromycin esterase
MSPARNIPALLSPSLSRNSFEQWIALSSVETLGKVNSHIALEKILIMTKRLLLAWVLVALSPLAAQDDRSILGQWEGTLTAPGNQQSLTLVFRTAQNAAEVTGTLDVPEQTLMLQVRPIKQGNHVQFDIQGVAIFEGTLAPDGRSIQGMFRQRGTEYPVTLKLIIASKPDTSAITAWIRKHAIPLKTVEPGSGLTDLAPLKQVVGNARIVAAGEATHGTREFFQLKHRIFEFLAERMGFTVFAIEANMPEAQRVNEYVLNGNGNPRELLDGLYVWSWKTEEVLNLIEWMRAYNANPAHKRKVKFYGFDMQKANVAMENVLDYIRRVDPEYATKAEGLLSGVPLTEAERNQFADSTETNRRVVKQVGEVLAQVDALPHTDAGWREARQDALVIQQSVQMMIAGKRSNDVRDEAMAANVAWILEQEDPDAKIMLWAHNAHVRANFAADKIRMGGHLRKRFGNEMAVIGFAFNQGSFQAIDAKKGLREFTVNPGPPESLDAVLTATKIPLFAIDLRAAGSRSIADWFKSPQKSREIGATYSEDQEFQMVEQAPAEAFDVLLFVEKTSRARSLLNRQP